MEPDRSVDEVPAVRTAEFGTCSEDVKDDGPMGVRLVEGVDPCSLAEKWRTAIKG